MSEALNKPVELLALHTVAEELFVTLQEWFLVPDEVGLNLEDVDAAVRDMADPLMIAALAMRKLQALRLISTPGVRTTTDIVITLIQDLDRALLQAPHMRLKRAAEATDWDAAFAELEHGANGHPSTGLAPREATEEDPEIEVFRARHGQLHEAVHAILVVSDGEVRHFI
ncbi:MAG: hypothetical protein ACC652_04495 [Acidimicrobiales bacterium]